MKNLWEAKKPFKKALQLDQTKALVNADLGIVFEKDDYTQNSFDRTLKVRFYNHLISLINFRFLFLITQIILLSIEKVNLVIFIKKIN